MPVQVVEWVYDTPPGGAGSRALTSQCFRGQHSQCLAWASCDCHCHPVREPAHGKAAVKAHRPPPEALPRRFDP